jgi:hypothetical protein
MLVLGFAMLLLSASSAQSATTTAHEILACANPIDFLAYNFTFDLVSTYETTVVKESGSWSVAIGGDPQTWIVAPKTFGTANMRMSWQFVGDCWGGFGLVNVSYPSAKGNQGRVKDSEQTVGVEVSFSGNIIVATYSFGVGLYPVIGTSFQLPPFGEEIFFFLQSISLLFCVI